MHSALILAMLILTAMMHQWLGRLHKLLNYTHIREQRRPLRGVRFVLALMVIAFGYELLKRHVLFTDIG